MPLVKSSDDIKDDKCPRCGIKFVDHPFVKTVVYKGSRRCAAYAACMARKRKAAIQRGNRDRFGKVDQKNPCEMLITRNIAKRGEPQIKVRCYCMAKFGAHRYHQMKYDILGLAMDLPDARRIWDEHVRVVRLAERVLSWGGLTSIPLDDTVIAKEDDDGMG